jgi:cell division septation protein DedD
MANDEKETKKTPGDGDIDKEVGLDDVLKDGDKIAAIHNDTPKGSSNKLKYLRNTLFVLLLAVVGLTVIGVSFKVGEKIFFAYKTMDKDSLQGNVTQYSKKIPNVAVPKTDEPVKGEVKSEVKESAPVKIIESASGQVDKVSDLVIEKNMIQPTPKVVAPVVKTERPGVTAKPGITAQAVKPAAIASTVRPATNAPRAVAKKKAAAKAPKTHKKYKVIVGSFSIKANADSLSSLLETKNYDPIIVQAMTPKGQLYRVIAGSYRSLRIAKTKMGELKELGFQSFYIFE